MRLFASIMILSTALFMGCNQSGSAVDEYCESECIVKIRPKAQACGENQTCKQAAVAELEACKVECKQ